MLDNPRDTQPQSVRVDLTSQDLRTGTIRLPRQLHDHFEPGSITALDHIGSSEHELTFLPPRELAGLSGFLGAHELRTNDAVIMHVDGQQLTLEPYYRSHRRLQEHENEPDGRVPTATDEMTTPDAEPAHGIATPEPREQVPHEPKVEAVAGEQQESTDTQLRQEQPEPQVRESFHMQPDLFGQHTQETQADPAPPAPDADAAQPDSSPDAFDSFASFDEFDSFEDIAGLTGLATADAPPTPRGDGPTGTTPASNGTDGEHHTGRSRPESRHHAVPRRPFTLRPSGGPGTAMRKVEALPTHDNGQEPVPGDKPDCTAGPADPQASPAGTSTAERIRRHLDGPDLPSILNGAELAGQLGLPVEEVLQELAGQSRLPDSRLSSVKPGFYLLKRRLED